MSMLKFPGNKADYVTAAEIATNAHLFYVSPLQRAPIYYTIAKKLGVTDEDLSHFENFAQNILEITALA